MTEVLLANAYIKGASDLLQGKIEGMPKVIAIPDGATNGDMIKAMFPNDSRCFISVNMDRNDWWNAPYNAESVEQEHCVCSTCVNKDEVDGSNCYECVKGIRNNYKEENEDEK